MAFDPSTNDIKANNNNETVTRTSKSKPIEALDGNDLLKRVQGNDTLLCEGGNDPFFVAQTMTASDLVVDMIGMKTTGRVAHKRKRYR